MTHIVAVVAFEGVSLFHLSVPSMVFDDELLNAEISRYKVFICAEQTGLITTMAGGEINVQYDFIHLSTADTIIIPAWRNTAITPSKKLLSAILDAHTRGARIVGLCLGAFVLGAAGLLNGRKATTHWAWLDEFQAAFDNVEVDRNALYVEDDRIISSAGTAAAIDCCLHLLRQDHGAEIANQVARWLVMAPHRYGGQAQYIDKPLPKSERPDQLSQTISRQYHGSVNLS